MRKNCPGNHQYHWEQYSICKEKHTITIHIALSTEHHVELSTEDDGPGFDANDLPNIITRFYKGKKGVFGLGLAISKNVVEKHHGEISAENTTEGALFRILLPVSK